MWTIGAVLFVLAGAGGFGAGYPAALWFLVLGGLCGARAESDLHDQEVALALFLWLIVALLVFSACAAAWSWIIGH